MNSFKNSKNPKNLENEKFIARRKTLLYLEH